MRSPNKKKRLNVKFSPGFRYCAEPKRYMRVYKAWWLTNEMKRLRVLHGGQCKNCKSKTNLQFAHIKTTKLRGVGRGKSTRVGDIKKNPTCYKLLCRTCHKEMDKANGTWCNKNNKS